MTYKKNRRQLQLSPTAFKINFILKNKITETSVNMAAKGRNSNNNNIGFWHMMRDVLVSSLNKGQFPVAILGVIILTWLIRLPETDLSKLTFETFDFFKTYYIGGYISTIGLALGWFYHSKRQRRLHTEEIARLSGERTEWQQKALETKKLPSSN